MMHDCVNVHVCMWSIHTYMHIHTIIYMYINVYMYVRACAGGVNHKCACACIHVYVYG